MNLNTEDITEALKLLGEGLDAMKEAINLYPDQPDTGKQEILLAVCADCVKWEKGIQLIRHECARIGLLSELSKIQAKTSNQSTGYNIRNN